ncbi:5-methyltetrahydropteroyltriglutamate--homocysteine S-methyltransferase [uncultured Marinococcus sp.]|uniref:5-methyltetrahydropteroyltriglutamate-- homocysteine S-methyltransferase n=1 Tax=uncultured Marinococcus sp. TaxID=487012 RepID=UPI00260BADC5|nr:5-methyltetrahydropteroyltriglutamate--homocysteine S-methyltransferase [uncultured Marinococcus sp.]
MDGLTNAPFRAEHVGSFLRPERLKKARQQYAEGELSAEALWNIENEEITALVKKQKEAGLPVVTDGEFRRAWFHLDFMQEVEGAEFIKLDQGLVFSDNTETKAEGVKVVNKLAFRDHPVVREYEFLHSLKGEHAARVTVPSPSMFIFRTVTEEEKNVYQSEAELFSDLVQVYKDTIQALYEAGCRHLQFDDTTWSLFLGAEKDRDLVLSGGLLEARGLDPKETLEMFVNTVNEAIADKPEDMRIYMHVCRGNYKSTYASSGSYDAVSEYMFSKLNVDALLLEFDDERSGGFEPLKYVNRSDLQVVLGLITSKFPELEDAGLIKSRLQEAKKHVPLKQLGLSPQCGFASTEEGNILTEEEQWAKVRHVVSLAEDVWK